jgi:hypothetical protein
MDDLSFVSTSLYKLQIRGTFHFVKMLKGCREEKNHLIPEQNIQAYMYGSY